MAGEPDGEDLDALPIAVEPVIATPTGAPSNAAEPVYVDDREPRAARRSRVPPGRRCATRPVDRRCLYCWANVAAWFESHRVGGDTGGRAGP